MKAKLAFAAFLMLAAAGVSGTPASADSPATPAVLAGCTAVSSTPTISSNKIVTAKGTGSCRSVTQADIYVKLTKNGDPAHRSGLGRCDPGGACVAQLATAVDDQGGQLWCSVTTISFRFGNSAAQYSTDKKCETAAWLTQY